MVKSENTTITLKKTTVNRMKKAMKYESYDEFINRLLGEKS